MASVDAQQTRIDSILQILEQSKTAKGVDSLRFIEALKLIEKSTLGDVSIGILEKASDDFITGSDEYWSYRVKYSILNSLIATDKRKSLNYGKQHFQEASKSKTPNALF